MSTIGGLTGSLVNQAIQTKQAELSNQAGTAVLKKSLDNAEAQGDAILQMLDEAAEIGKNLDVKG